VLTQVDAAAGIGLLDLGHGSFRVAALRGEHGEPGLRGAVRELERHGVAELLADGVECREFGDVPAAPMPGAAALAESRETLGDALRRLPPAAARAALLGHAYLLETQRGALRHLQAPHLYEVEQGLGLDPATRRNLEIVERLDGQRQGSLLWVLDDTRSVAGRRLLREWLERPLSDLAEIGARQEAVVALFEDGLSRLRLRDLLSRARDMERLLAKLGAGSAGPRDFVALAATLALGPELAAGLPEGGDRLSVIGEVLREPLAVTAEIGAALQDEPPALARDGNFVRQGFSDEIDRLRAAKDGAKEYLVDFERRAREETGIRTLKVGFNKVFGYYIEVTRANLQLVPAQWERRQTIASGERFVTDELRRQEELIARAERELQALEAAVLENVRQAVLAEAPAVQARAAALAELDVLQSLAEVGRRRGYVRPELRREPVLDLVGARHPVVEALLPQGAFVPNDTRLDARGQRLHLITGPNMGGKSTVLRQVALLQVMAQAGSLVPAERAVIGLADRVFTRVGASDDLARGVSTFMAEMLEVAVILRDATAQSLVVLDEVGRGTGTADGVAIASAVTEYLGSVVRCRALVATHYLELCGLAEREKGIRNFTVAVAEEGRKVVFLHRIVPGAASRSYGLDVARLAGVPEAVLARAEERLLSPVAASASDGAVQLALFDVPPHPAIERLRALDPLRMTPLEALAELAALKGLCEEVP
jgi:DNA mismatch repair protein MutS